MWSCGPTFSFLVMTQVLPLGFGISGPLSQFHCGMVIMVCPPPVSPCVSQTGVAPSMVPTTVALWLDNISLVCPPNLPHCVRAGGDRRSVFGFPCGSIMRAARTGGGNPFTLPSHTCEARPVYKPRPKPQRQTNSFRRYEGFSVHLDVGVQQTLVCLVVLRSSHVLGVDVLQHQGSAAC